MFVFSLKHGLSTRKICPATKGAFFYERACDRKSISLAYLHRRCWKYQEGAEQQERAVYVRKIVSFLWTAGTSSKSDSGDRSRDEKGGDNDHIEIGDKIELDYARDR